MPNAPREAPRSGRPSHDGKRPDSATDDDDAFGAEERAFQLEVAAVAAEGAARSHHPVARDIPVPTPPHDVPDRPRGPRVPGHLRHVAVSSDAPRGDPTDDRQDETGEIRDHIYD